MRLNLRKINQLIREAWTKGQAASVRGAGKSSCYSWSWRVARDYFPDIAPLVVERIARGQARLHWDAEKRVVVVVPTAPGDVATEELDDMPQEATTKIQTCAQRVANPVWLHQQITALVTSCDDDIAEDQELADKESDGAKQSLYLERVASHHHWKHQLERILAGKTADEDFADTLAAQGVQP